MRKRITHHIPTSNRSTTMVAKSLAKLDASEHTVVSANDRIITFLRPLVSAR